MIVGRGEAQTRGLSTIVWVMRGLNGHNGQALRHCGLLGESWSSPVCRTEMYGRRRDDSHHRGRYQACLAGHAIRGGLGLSLLHKLLLRGLALLLQLLGLAHESVIHG